LHLATEVEKLPIPGLKHRIEELIPAKWFKSNERGGTGLSGRGVRGKCEEFTPSGEISIYITWWGIVYMKSHSVADNQIRQSPVTGFAGAGSGDEKNNRCRPGRSTNSKTPVLGKKEMSGFFCGLQGKTGITCKHWRKGVRSRVGKEDSGYYLEKGKGRKGLMCKIEHLGCQSETAADADFLGHQEYEQETVERNGECP